MRGGKYLSFDMFWPTKSTNIRLSPTQLLCQLCRLCLKWCNPEFFTHPHFPANLLMALASMILCSGLVMPQLAQRLGSMVSTTLPSFSNLSMMTVLFSCSRSQSNWSFNLRWWKMQKVHPKNRFPTAEIRGKHRKIRVTKITGSLYTLWAPSASKYISMIPGLAPLVSCLTRQPVNLKNLIRSSWNLSDLQGILLPRT